MSDPVGASSYDEYAALVRHLGELYRSAEHADARGAEQRAALNNLAAQLDQRLSAQRQRLATFARTIGEPPPGSPAATLAPAAGGYVPPRQAAAPAYPELPTGAARPPMPALPGPGRPAAVPPASVPASPSTVAAAPGPGAAPPPRVPASAPVSPEQELELARRAADLADEAMSGAEALARQPALLPGLTPLVRALVVYLGCGLVAMIGQLVLLFTAGLGPEGNLLERIEEAGGLGTTFSVFAWGCAGLPALAFFAGYLVLSVWGKPKIAGEAPDFYGRLGFVVCFIMVWLAGCVWFVNVQVFPT